MTHNSALHPAEIRAAALPRCWALTCSCTDMFRLSIAALFLMTSAAIPAQFSTFFKENSSISKIAADAQGNLYMLGDVSASPIPGRGRDIFLAKLDAGATKFAYFVYFGGSLTEASAGLAVDVAGNAY